ncbi:hypothetical protein H2198_005332 [Neophaeococcomyces mojaviensis]|uniref:Uncharacterized protein n=1 Tax=Neophaeococcomyces mojaviensis TaxID=3383035 RepID=A0ACC3A676_9EURO|nr:hypothetical protein H2198_005332 [Knufia sp. JES_112]
MLSIVLAVLIITWHKQVKCQDKIPGHFKLAGRSGVPAMHAALLPDGNVIFLDKIEDYTEMWLPDHRLAYSSIYEPKPEVDYRLTPVPVYSNAFCCGGAYLADGTLMTMGGNGPLTWLDDTVTDGFDALRYLYTQEKHKIWQEHQGIRMSSKRWYPSVQTLSDGRVFIAAGSLNGLDIRNNSNNNPTYELLDKDGKPQGESMPMEILVKNQPY